VKKHGAERAAKGFTSWTQFVAMLFCQLARADSLRDICNGLACCLGRLVHLGIARAPSRSTLSYANEHRPAALFEELFWTALARFRDQQVLGSRKHQFRFKNKLLSLDSTTISLCLTHAKVERVCQKYYKKSPYGRPSMTPGVYFRCLLIGYFEGLDSERGIAWRTADSLSLRQFLGYALDEATPDHSTISRTRRLYWLETHKAVFRWCQRRSKIPQKRRLKIPQ
jgi:transposase